jgi:hypothetical protein
MQGQGSFDEWGFQNNLELSCGHRDPMNNIGICLSKMSKVRLPSQFGQGMHILMENFLGNWPIISPSHMKNDMNEANANYNPFPTIYVQDDLVSLFYELGLQGNPIVYQICLRNSNVMSCFIILQLQNTTQKLLLQLVQFMPHAQQFPNAKIQQSMWFKHHHVVFHSTWVPTMLHQMSLQLQTIPILHLRRL